MRRPAGLLLVALLLSVAPAAHADHLGAGFGSTIAGPIVTVPATTLPARRWAASVRLEWVTFDAFSDEELEAFAAADEEVHSIDALLAPSLNVAYGVTDRLTLAARLPYISRTEIREGHLEGGVPEAHSHGDAAGLGDLSLLGQLRVTPGGATHHLALLAGLKAPTGASDVETEDGEPFETEHQPGSGALDVLLGAAWSHAGNIGSTDANVLWALTGEGEQETKLGNQLQANLALSLSLIAHSHELGGGLDAVFEVNGEWHSRNEVAGEEEENSGGRLLYLAPGLRYVSGGRWTLSGSVGFPVSQGPNGTQHETELKVNLGAGVQF